MKSNIQRIVLILSLLLAASVAREQDLCGFDKLQDKLLRKNPAFKERMEAQEKWMQEYISSHRSDFRDMPTTALYTIPVVVHVIHTGGAVGTIYNPSNATIQNAINYLNQVYDGSYPGLEGVGDIQIQFELAKMDPNCNPTTGIDRVNGSILSNYSSAGVNIDSTNGVDEIEVKNLTRWDPTRYYNVWVVDKIDSKDGTSGTFYGGFAYFPGVPLEYDGIIMLATQMQPNRKTLPHEIGHALSLYHPFQGASGSTCPTNASCNTDGDKVCDTDPITLPAGFVCRTGNNSCTGTPYSINTEHNIMNYTNCSTLFTDGQKTRMLAAAAAPFRNGLITSAAMLTVPPVTPFNSPIAPSCAPDTDTSGMAPYGYAGILNMNITNLNLASGPTAYDGGYLDGASRCLNMVVLRRGDTYNFTTTLFGYNRGQLRIWIDYNNNGSFNNSNEQILYQSDVSPTNPLKMDVSGNFTVPLTATTNTFLRMRVMDEVSVIYGAFFGINNACYVPQYGQAEDYPVYIQPELALPLTFEYFRATPGTSSVNLEWKTSEHVQVEKFIIERAGSDLHFAPIGELPVPPDVAGGTWQFVDHQPLDEVAYYRIRETDFDGRYQFSKTVAVQAESTSGPFIRIAGNPVSSTLELRLSKRIESNGWIRVFDLSGRMIFTRLLPAGTEKVYRLDLTGHPLSRGLYQLEVEVAGRHFTDQFIKE